MLFTALGGAILQPIYEVHPQETLLYSVNCEMFYSNYPGNVGLSGEVLLQESPAECDRTTWRRFYGIAISLLFVPMHLEKR